MIPPDPVLRLVYTSVATTGDDPAVLASILNVSRRYNGIDGVSGILWASDGRYLQLLEGPPESVRDAFARISLDARHADITIVEERHDVERAFGDWAMASVGPGEQPEDAIRRLHILLAHCPDDVRRHFDTASLGR